VLPGEAPFVVFGVLGLGSIAAWVLRPLVMGLGRRLEGKGGPDPALATEVEELRRQVQELQAERHRLMDVEDRLDFAERMLAQRREEPQALPGGER
jgi:DNA repair exonuclease SbcCD ATPase subunit